MKGMVLYDGECGFCAGQVRFLGRHDSEELFRFVPLQSDEGKKILRSAGMSENELDTVVYQKNGRYLKRSGAVLNIMRDLGGLWRLLYGLIIIPPFIRDFFYSLFARNRHRFVTGRAR